MSATKIVVADEIDAEGLEPLQGKNGFKLVVVNDPARLAAEIGDAQALLVRSKTKVDAALLEKGKALKFVGRAGVGVDNIDVASASKRGIVVANVPGGNTISAAEHTMAMILAISRNIPKAHASVSAGLWERNKFIGTELQGKTLGLLGFGRIGREVARRALSFEMKVMAYDPFVSEQNMKAQGILAASMDDVLAKSDYISLHMPVTDQTKAMINAQALAKMKPDCRLINCARGELVDEPALVAALKAKKIKGAALDVFSAEPPKTKDFLTLDNVVLTPHLGASTEEAQVKVAYELSLALRDFFDRGVIRNAVNLPSVEPELLERVTPFIKLSEALGTFIAQVVEGGMEEIRVEFAGDFSPPMRNLLNLSAVKGILSSAMGEGAVNWVNAMPIAKDRGIRLEDASTTDTRDYTALITLKVKTDKQTRSVSGTILTSGKPRIVRIDEMSVDIVPEGHMIIFTNIDQPGVVGFIGTLLGKNNINIAAFQVGRKQAGGEAVSVLNVDSPVPAPVMDEIRGFSGIKNVWMVKIA
ncbi:MAG: phosphoglycerate dehydrogenase [Elusimicrobia bacterium RIFCSPLOWO2_01_FULL_54_10]|nr:MAG: phosphoglycerate dehydrogenase [Elusimicrobia bacterium RIFCSPLOWO2_01_FULL_54_10]